MLIFNILTPLHLKQAPVVPVSVVRRIAKECIAVVQQHSTDQAADVDELVATVIRRLSGK